MAYDRGAAKNTLSYPSQKKQRKVMSET
jgi:hypothetical protein